MEKGHWTGPLRCAGCGLRGGVLQVDTKAVGFPWETPFLCHRKGPCPPAEGVRGGQCVPGSPVATPCSRCRQGGKQVFPSQKDQVHSTHGSQAGGRRFCGLLTSFPGSRAAFWRLQLASLIAFTSSSHPVGLAPPDFSPF